jgi:hypothetical protein
MPDDTIKIGDFVRAPRDGARYEVVGINRGMAHLFYEPQNYHRLIPLSDLTPAPDKEA